ncbi:MAG: hypothetical protein NTW87_34930 [Planctomycetota bacterium]|nr:hypothetical protein [Planctomycetota bacterium]
MTDAPKKRPFFQFHLSTAVVLVFAAAGLLWANMHERKAVAHFLDQEWEWDRSRSEVQIEAYVVFHGWPSFCTESLYLFCYSEPDHFCRNDCKPLSLALNALVALFVLLATAVLLEWLIRRKERRP